jgi:NADH dehydrogenase/NADH:ubiquinone oxidoreductase subunit G
MIPIIVDAKEILVEEGKTLLQACLEKGIYIPNLCFLEGMDDPPASCRMCYVDIEGFEHPVISCKVEPRAGMVVKTDTPRVRRLQQTSLRLLLTVHEAKCKPCPSNRRCVLQRLVRLLGVRIRPRRYEHLDRVIFEAFPHPLLEIIHTRCILCGKCVHVCMERTGKAYLTFARKGLDTIVSAVGEETGEMIDCEECRACAEICPVSALFFRDEAGEPASEETTG